MLFKPQIFPPAAAPEGYDRRVLHQHQAVRGCSRNTLFNQRFLPFQGFSVTQITPVDYFQITTSHLPVYSPLDQVMGEYSVLPHGVFSNGYDHLIKIPGYDRINVGCSRYRATVCKNSLAGAPSTTW